MSKPKVEPWMVDLARAICFLDCRQLFREQVKAVEKEHPYRVPEENFEAAHEKVARVLASNFIAPYFDLARALKEAEETNREQTQS